MPKRWIDWPHDECPACGDDVQIETSHPDGPADDFGDEFPQGEPLYVYNGDAWRCLGEPAHCGDIYCDSETPVTLEETRWRG